MTRYLFTRVSLFVPSLLLASLAIFVSMHVLPGDVALVVAGAGSDTTRIDPQQLEQIRAALGLNDPLPVQYARWLWSLVDGQFGGASIITHEGSASILQRTFPVTLELAVLAAGIAWLASIPVGVVAAFYRNRWPDYLIRVVTISGHSLPSFWLALLFLLAATLVFRWNPPIYYSNLWEDPGANLAKMIWPALILALAFSAYLARVTRSSLIEELNRDYVRTARGKGLSNRGVAFKHALRNALIPVTTVGGLQIGALLGGSVILETIFGLPGIGQEMVSAASTRDYPVVQNLTLFLVLLALLLNLGVDVLYTVLDPRVRLAK